jgi:hypothetical protein
MSNRYGIPEEDEKEIRARDKACVFCHASLKRPSRARRASEATIEHFSNEGPLRKKYNLAICCRGCNSSKGTKRLLAWFKTPYCRKRKINEKTVAKPVKQYIRLWMYKGGEPEAKAVPPAKPFMKVRPPAWPPIVLEKGVKTEVNYETWTCSDG